MGDGEKKLATEDQREDLGFSLSGLLYLTEWTEESLRTGTAEVSDASLVRRVPLACTYAS